MHLPNLLQCLEFSVMEYLAGLSRPLNAFFFMNIGVKLRTMRNYKKEMMTCSLKKLGQIL